MTKPPFKTLDQIIVEETTARLEYFEGDRVKTAQSLGRSRTTLFNWIHTYGLEKWKTPDPKFRHRGGARRREG